MGGRDGQEVWDRHVHTAVFKMENEQGPTVSMRNSTQYSVMAYMGKESKKEWIFL